MKVVNHIIPHKKQPRGEFSSSLPHKVLVAKQHLIVLADTESSVALTTNDDTVCSCNTVKQTARQNQTAISNLSTCHVHVFPS